MSPPATLDDLPTNCDVGMKKGQQAQRDPLILP